jgi:iron(II)-dependent oxidoreductase
MPTIERQVASPDAVLDTQTRLANWEPQSELHNGVDMVKVPAGCFMMGGSPLPDLPNDTLVFPVCLDEFWLDTQEVWNEQFDVHGATTGVASWDDVLEHPRTNVTWEEALDYCLLRGARLPTEAEWEYAARGPFSHAYPWGDEFDTQFVSDDGSPVAVYDYGEAISWVGAFHMAGNAAEWTSSRMVGYPYVADDGREDLPANAADLRVVRGGAFFFFNTPNDLHAATRLSSLSGIDGGLDVIGFRCARDGDMSADDG